jgi:hypothetical protein
MAYKLFVIERLTKSGKKSALIARLSAQLSHVYPGENGSQENIRVCCTGAARYTIKILESELERGFQTIM